VVLAPGQAYRHTQGRGIQIRSAQKPAWENKVAKGFNTTSVPLEFCLLQGEIAEAFAAWRKGREDVGEELADVAIYLLSLAEMTGIDSQDQIEAKNAAQGEHGRDSPGATYPAVGDHRHRRDRVDDGWDQRQCGVRPAVFDFRVVARPAH
jgi:hypothetical protein